MNYTMKEEAVSDGLGQGGEKMKRPNYLTWCGIILSTILASAALPGCTTPDSDLAFFNGKTVTIVVPHGPGGMDTYAQLIAPQLQKFLPGSKVRTENVPEGGGIAGKNLVYEAAPDGLTLGFTSGGGTLLAEWAEQPGVMYKTAALSMIGRINAESHILVASPKTGFSKLGDLIRAKEVSMGFPGVGSDDYYVALLSSRLLGFKVKARTEFDGINSASFACVKGEVDTILFSEASVLPQVEAKTLVPLACFAEKRSSGLPEVPSIFEAVSQEKIHHLRLLVQLYDLERVLFAPPELPPGRLKALRGALDKVIEDPELQHNAAKLKRPINYLPGPETERILKNILAGEQTLRPLVLEIIKKGALR